MLLGRRRGVCRWRPSTWRCSSSAPATSARRRARARRWRTRVERGPIRRRRRGPRSAQCGQARAASSARAQVGAQRHHRVGGGAAADEGGQERRVVGALGALVEAATRARNAARPSVNARLTFVLGQAYPWASALREPGAALEPGRIGAAQFWLAFGMPALARSPLRSTVWTTSSPTSSRHSWLRSDPCGRAASRHPSRRSTSAARRSFTPAAVMSSSRCSTTPGNKCRRETRRMGADEGRCVQCGSNERRHRREGHNGIRRRTGSGDVGNFNLIVPNDCEDDQDVNGPTPHALRSGRQVLRQGHVEQVTVGPGCPRGVAFPVCAGGRDGD